jgi:acetyl esterase/lipase
MDLIKITKGDNDDRPIPGCAAQIMLNVPYGSHPAQTLDIYLPPGRSVSSTKILVIIHGGGFNSGNKDELTTYIQPMQRRLADYAFFNISYRQAAMVDTLFPTQENDVKAALQFIVNKSSDYLVSKKLVLLGVSAGGLLALLQGYKYKEPVVPKAIVSFFAPTDLVALYQHSLNPLVPLTLRQVTGKTPAQDPFIYTESSPINFVSADSPPTLLLQGGLDPLVDPEQQTCLQEKLTDAGVVNQYVFYATEGHGWQGAKLEDSFNKIETFLNENVH